jgi:hypothetical protein
MHQYEPRIGECVARIVFDDHGHVQDAGRQTCASNANMPVSTVISWILLVILVFFGIREGRYGTPGSFRDTVGDGRRRREGQI